MSIVRSRLGGIDADRIDAELGQEAGDFRIVRRRLAAYADLASVPLGAADGQAQHLQHAGIALVEIERDDVGIAVDAERELGQVVRADRESVEHLGEGVDLDDVVGDLAHHVDLEPVLAALQAVARHRGQHLFGFDDAPAEGHHDQEIGQPHDVAHAPQRLAFERESVGVGGVRVARGAAKAEHRIGLVRLEGGAAEELRRIRWS